MTCSPVAPRQTLFLGASIVDFNISMGWGGQPSQLSVTLVEDNEGCDSSGSSNGGDPPNMISSGYPAKIYYTSNDNGIIANDLRLKDPGFSGANSVGAACYFQMGSTQFIGFIKSWELQNGFSGSTYSVTLESLDSILNQSYIITNKYDGSIFTMTAASVQASGNYGAPFNFTSNPGLRYTGPHILEQGAIPNVFNVYGFLESGGFGASGKTDRGISPNLIKKALTVLTSAEPASTVPAQFSPYGRIIFHGIAGANSIPAGNLDAGGIARYCAVLDLSELPETPSFYGIDNDVMTINEFVSNVTEATGCDYYWQTRIRASAPDNFGTNGPAEKAICVLKLRIKNRNATVDLNAVSGAISNLGNQVTSNSIGQEYNVVNNRAMIIGGSQQRIYQATNQRLAYSQSNYIWHPITAKFIDLGRYKRGIARLSNPLSIRNPYITYASSGDPLTTAQQDIQNVITADFNADGNYNTYSDTYSPTITAADGSAMPVINPPPATDVFSQIFPTPTGYNITIRYIPLIWDIIFPFFGFVGINSETPAANSTGSNPNFKNIRVPYIDTWTGNLVIIVAGSELPLNMQVSLGGYFLITETEIRAATAGWESYLTYCMTKTYKPELYSALLRAYKYTLTPDTEAEEKEQLIAGKNEDGNDSLLGTTNVANNLGYLVGGAGTPTPDLTININWILNPDMLRDFIKISEFVASFGQYYGKSYMVRVPKIDSYRDMSTQNTFTIDTTYTGASIVGYRGTGKIYFKYEPAPDGGWEEYGNKIGAVTVGSADWYSLTNEDGKIPPILAYNARTSVDYVQKELCNKARSGTNININLNNLHMMLNAAYYSNNKPASVSGSWSFSSGSSGSSGQ